MSDIAQQETDVDASVTITVDIEKLLSSGTFGKQYDEDGDYIGRKGLTELVAEIVAHKLAKDLRDSVNELVAEAAVSKVDAIIDEVINGEIRQTNNWGETVGTPTTLRETIIKSVGTELNRRVNARGEAANGYRDGSMTYVEYLSKLAAQKALKEEFEPAIAASIAEIKSGITGIVSESIASRIMKEIQR